MKKEDLKKKEKTCIKKFNFQDLKHNQLKNTNRKQEIKKIRKIIFLNVEETYNKWKRCLIIFKVWK